MANNWAIAIGINQYELLPPHMQLRFAVKDAQNIRNFLCHQAGFSEHQILLCSDDSPAFNGLSTRPTRANLRKLLRREIPQAKGADTFWFFFSGHGMVGRDNKDYLVPCDGDLSDLEETAISSQFVTDCLRHCEAQTVVLVLDMCRNEGASFSKGTGAGVGARTVELAREQGIITIFSCTRGEASFEISELKQGTFTSALIEGLSRHTILRQLEQYLIRRVPELNRQFQKPIQVPRIVVEPAWKYNLPILTGLHSTDIAYLKEQASNAFFAENWELSAQLWEKVNELATNQSDRSTAIQAIRKIAQRQVAPQISLAQPFRPPDIGIEQSRSILNSQSAPQPVHQPRSINRGARSRPPDSSATNQPTSATASRSIPLAQPQPVSSTPITRQSFLKRLMFAGAAVILFPVLAEIRQGYDLPVVPFQPPDISPAVPAEYAKLAGFLEAKQWKEADEETIRVMLKISDREKEGYLTQENIEAFPCNALHVIDQLWVKNSNRRFGFSVQQKIYVESGAKLDGSYPGDTSWIKFMDSIGWNGLYPDQNHRLQSVIFNTSAPTGHLPVGVFEGSSDRTVQALEAERLGSGAPGSDLPGATRIPAPSEERAPGSDLPGTTIIHHPSAEDRWEFGQGRILSLLFSRTAICKF